MSILKAGKQQIPYKYQLLASGFVGNKNKDNKLNTQKIPVVIQYLFISFYIESDEWLLNKLYLLSNDNKTTKCLTVKEFDDNNDDQVKQAFMCGKLQMNGLQNDNVIYEWNVHIDNCVNQSLQIGLINNEYLTKADVPKQIYFS